jgi:hypothetical protein
LGVKVAGAYHSHVPIFFFNPGASDSWDLQGLSRPVHRLL